MRIRSRRARVATTKKWQLRDDGKWRKKVEISHLQECFTGKYTTCKIHMKLHPGPEWRIFHILTSEDIDDVISHGCFCKQSAKKNGKQ